MTVPENGFYIPSTGDYGHKVPTSPPHAMDHHEKMKIRAASFRAVRLFSPGIGRALSEHLMSWEEFGYRFGGYSQVMMLADEILKMPLPEQKATFPHEATA